MHYDHGERVRMLSARGGATEADVHAALFQSGLKRDAELGLNDAEQQTGELSLRLGTSGTLDGCVVARAARTAGLQAHCFRDIATLRALLRVHALLEPAGE